MEAVAAEEPDRRRYELAAALRHELRVFDDALHFDGHAGCAGEALESVTERRRLNIT